MTDNLVSLSPCPFCGGRALECLNGDPSGYVVYCAQCDCQTGPNSTASYAAQTWNRRTPDDSQARRIADLERALIDMRTLGIAFLAKTMTPEEMGRHPAMVSARAALSGTTPAPDVLTESGRAALQEDK